ncbi:MAG: hypothetical protein F6K55_37280 [Moorea sp. SIO4A3]|nr:hypothetical protein [Moorena sp. SIO4A3]
MRYGADYLNPGYELKNKGKSAPNAPYYCSLFPVPCSLKSRNCVCHSYKNCYINALSFVVFSN